MQKRYALHDCRFETREENGEKRIEGYFAVFNSNYEIAPGMSESISRTAFDGTLSDDIRALINHDTTLVIGRTGAGTLNVRVDDHGLWGSVLINPNDQDALNIYARVQRGDVSQCSIGFDILKESTETYGADVHWTIEDVKLYEVSVCTFPAYVETEVAARSKDVENIRKREEEAKKARLEAWKERTKERLKGESHGTETADDFEKSQGEESEA